MFSCVTSRYILASSRKRALSSRLAFWFRIFTATVDVEPSSSISPSTTWKFTKLLLLLLTVMRMSCFDANYWVVIGSSNLNLVYSFFQSLIWIWDMKRAQNVGSFQQTNIYAKNGFIPTKLLSSIFATKLIPRDIFTLTFLYHEMKFVVEKLINK